MAEQVSVIHPRKLYAMLRACPSRQDRARAALDFLINCTAAASGFLMVRDGGELEMAASSPNLVAPQSLMDEVQRAWERELDTPHDDSKTKTIDVSAIKVPARSSKSPLWEGPGGERFDHRVLSTYRGRHWVPVGIAVFEPERESNLLRQAHIEAVCNAFIDAGDVPGPTTDTLSRPK
jgi:hypothetical protein